MDRGFLFSPFYMESTGKRNWNYLWLNGWRRSSPGCTLSLKDSRSFSP